MAISKEITSDSMVKAIADAVSQQLQKLAEEEVERAVESFRKEARMRAFAAVAAIGDHIMYDRTDRLVVTVRFPDQSK